MLMTTLLINTYFVKIDLTVFAWSLLLCVGFVIKTTAAFTCLFVCVVLYALCVCMSVNKFCRPFSLAVLTTLSISDNVCELIGE